MTMLADLAKIGWHGSVEDYMIYTVLQKLGKRPDQDFIYRPTSLGGAGAPLVFSSPPNLAIQVRTARQDSTLPIRREQLAGQGVHLIFINGADLERDPTFYVEEALQYQDHSELG